MHWDVNMTSEDEDEMISKIAKKIHEHGLDVVAILVIETIKPLSFIGMQMGRLLVSPFLPVFGENIGISGEKFLQIFEKRENVEKLIKIVENLAREDKERQEAEKAKKLETGEKPNKKWWQRLIP